jgi:hypothetical protein
VRRSSSQVYARAASTGPHSKPITPHGVREVDRLDTPIGVMEEEPHLLKSIFEAVTELGVAHGVAS